MTYGLPDTRRSYARYTNDAGEWCVMWWYPDDLESFTDAESGTIWRRSGKVVKAYRKPDPTDLCWTD